MNSFARLTAASQVGRIQGQVPPGLLPVGSNKMAAAAAAYPQDAYNQAAHMFGHGAYNQAASMSGHGAFNQQTPLSTASVSMDAYNEELAREALAYQSQLQGATNRAAPPQDDNPWANDQETMHVPGQGFPTAEEPAMPPNSGWGSASNESALAQGPQSNYDLSLEQGHDVMHLDVSINRPAIQDKRKSVGDAGKTSTKRQRRGPTGKKNLKAAVPPASNDESALRADEVIEDSETSTAKAVSVDDPAQEKPPCRKAYTRKTGNNEDYSVESLIAQRIAFLTGTLINLPTFLKECGRSGFRLAYIQGIQAGTAMINAATAAAAMGLELLKVSASIDPNTTDPALQAMRLTPGEALLIKKKALAAVLRSAPAGSVQNDMQYYRLSPEEDQMITESLNVPPLCAKEPSPNEPVGSAGGGRHVAEL